jgi:hypothetical protein
MYPYFTRWGISGSALSRVFVEDRRDERKAGAGWPLDYDAISGGESSDAAAGTDKGERGAGAGERELRGV